MLLYESQRRMRDKSKGAFCFFAAGLGLCGHAAGAQPIYQLFPDAEIVLATSVGDSRDLLHPVAGDLNGDGVPDLLRLRRDTSQGSIYVSIGREVWEARDLGDLGIPTDTRVQDATSADVDNDGDIDLVCWAADGTLGDRAIGVLLNDGSGALTSVASDPFSALDLELIVRRGSAHPTDTIAAGDVNGDGFQDVVVVSGSVAVFTGDGSGRFFLAEILEDDETSLELVDIDGDGIKEIATANRRFFTIRRWQDGTWARVFSRGNADELLDATSLVSMPRCDAGFGAVLAAIDGASTRGIDYVKTISVDDQFVFESEALGSLASGATAVKAVDVLGGAGPDLVSPSVEAIADANREGFDTRTTRPAFGTSFGVGDLDLNGNADLVSMGNRVYRPSRTVLTLDFRMIVGEGESRGVVPPRVEAVQIPDSEPLSSLGIGIGDFDGDGRRDIFVSSRGSPVSRVFYQNADGSFEPLVLPQTSRTARVLVADVDGDGLDDVILRTAGTRVQVNFSEPGRVFAPRLGIETGLDATSVVLPAVGDINNDGLNDLVVYGVGSIRALLQTAPRVFEITHMWEGDASGVGIDMGDIDGDGDADFAVAAGPDLGVLVFRSNGDGSFANPSTIAQGGFVDGQPLPELLEFADLDRDGDLDLVNYSEAANKVVLNENDGSGGFVASAELTFACSTSGGSPGLLTGGVADFNGDGYADITIGCGSGEVSVYAGAGDAALGWSLLAIVSNLTEAVTQIGIGDIDADGFPDLVVPFKQTSSFDPNLAGFQVLENLTRPQARCPADLAIPFGTLDLADITAFIGALLDEDPSADIAARFGVFDLADIVAFVETFADGCD